MTFEKVVVYSNWCYIDQLAGIDLQDGERVAVRWPDGTVTKETVGVDSSTEETTDHGHRCPIPIRKSYIDLPIVSHRGYALTSRIFLNTTELELKRVPNGRRELTTVRMKKRKGGKAA